MSAQRPQDIHHRFVEAFNRGDVEALVSLYEAGSVLALRRGEAIGHEAIREAYEKIVHDGANMELETRAVVESTDGLALLHARWKYHREREVITGLSTEVVRRQPDGTWLFVLDEPDTNTNPIT